jgi:hypothetical protein
MEVWSKGAITTLDRPMRSSRESRSPHRLSASSVGSRQHASDRYLELGDTIRVGSRLRKPQYDLLDDAQAALDARLRH